MTTDLSQSKYFWINSEKYEQIELNRKIDLNCANNILNLFLYFSHQIRMYWFIPNKNQYPKKSESGEGGAGKESF